MSEEEMSQVVYHEWYRKWHTTDQSIFRNSNIYELHHGVGRNIRNYFNLWNRPYEPDDIRNGIDYSLNHPDAISTRILKRVQELAINDYQSNR